MTVAYNNFTAHMQQCHEALKVYEYLRSNGYSANFGLRFVWVASISALDHYISELIVEECTKLFSNGSELSSRLLTEGVPVSALIKLNGANAVEAVIEFRSMISQVVRTKTFQKADDISDGLAFVWNEKHKWNAISGALGMENRNCKRKLNSIGIRRDQIVHNADYNYAYSAVSECRPEDASQVIEFVEALVVTIDQLVAS